MKRPEDESSTNNDEKSVNMPTILSAEVFS